MRSYLPIASGAPPKSPAALHPSGWGPMNSRGTTTIPWCPHSQVDRLELLGFEWAMSDAQAKWVNMYHQLRRFKAVHGHTRVPPGYRNSEEPGWEILARWAGWPHAHVRACVCACVCDTRGLCVCESCAQAGNETVARAIPCGITCGGCNICCKQAEQGPPPPKSDQLMAVQRPSSPPTHQTVGTTRRTCSTTAQLS